MCEQGSPDNTVLSHSTAVQAYYRWLDGAGAPVLPEMLQPATATRRLLKGHRQPASTGPLPESAPDSTPSNGHQRRARYDTAPFGLRADGEPRKRRPGPGRPSLQPEERAVRRAASSRRWREDHRDVCAAYAREYRRHVAVAGSIGTGAETHEEQFDAGQQPALLHESAPDKLRSDVDQLIADTEALEKRVDTLHNEWSSVTEQTGAFPGWWELDRLRARIDEAVARIEAHDEQLSALRNGAPGVVARATAPFERQELDGLKADVAQMAADIEAQKRQWSTLDDRASGAAEKRELDKLEASIAQMAAANKALEEQWATQREALSKGLDKMAELARDVSEDRATCAKEQEEHFRQIRSAHCQQADDKQKGVLWAQPDFGGSCTAEVEMVINGAFPGLMATDPDIIVGADTLDNGQYSQSWAGKVHRAFLSLSDYVQAEFKGDFKRFCAAARCDIPATWVAPHEPDATENRERFRNARTFKVSPEIDPSGKVYMSEHLILGDGGTAPRLYYYDDKRGPTHKVHIGYVGPHLRSRDTN